MAREQFFRGRMEYRNLRGYLQTEGMGGIGTAAGQQGRPEAQRMGGGRSLARCRLRSGVATV